MNRETLKQAIAEAKTIKETAIANAKLALEEAFTPQLTAMFAERLNEMDEEEEEAKKSMEENYGMEEEGIEENFDIDSILAELEMTGEGDEMEKDMDAGVDEDLMLEEMSDEDIEALVAQVIDDMIASGKLMAGEEAEEEDMEDEEDMMGDEDEEIDIDIEDDEEKDIDETIAEILAEMEEGDEEKLDEVGFADPETAQLVAQVADYLNTSKDAIYAAIAALPATVAVGGFLRGMMKAKKDKSNDGMKEANEMEDTISELRNELNEVNLLNAKLLYTNKIFKAKNLTESDKIKVLNAFDKAENVKGVKLVYETLTESLKATSIVKKSQVRESLGSASRTITPATPKQPIIESNEAFARMQRLAGIKK
jgi:hypothetical protein